MTTPSLIGPPETLTWIFETEPPFEHSTVPVEILETNDPPADTHMGSLRDFIARGTPRRARLDSKIAILQAALDRTRAERDILDSEIRKHEGAVSSWVAADHWILMVADSADLTLNPPRATSLAPILHWHPSERLK